MDNKILEIFIPGPAGRLEAKYYKSKKNTSPIALVLQPHPQYGGTMNNKVVVDTFHTFMDNDFSVCRVNFRGVGKSDGEFDNGQGELADAAAALDARVQGGWCVAPAVCISPRESWCLRVLFFGRLRPRQCRASQLRGGQRMPGRARLVTSVLWQGGMQRAVAARGRCGHGRSRLCCKR